jgi:hypothetical protein
LADSNCGGCHGEKAALEVKLYTKKQWTTSFDLIALKTGGTDEIAPAMPPGDTMPIDLIELIQYWGEAGHL